MIFTNVSADRTVKLDAKDLEGVIRIYNELREKAASFINEKERLHEMRASLCDCDEVTFTNEEVVWTYEINTACHCHPEYEKQEKKFSLNEFQQWLTTREEEFYIGEPVSPPLDIIQNTVSIKGMKIKINEITNETEVDTNKEYIGEYNGKKYMGRFVRHTVAEIPELTGFNLDVDSTLFPNGIPFTSFVKVWEVAGVELA